MDWYQVSLLISEVAIVWNLQPLLEVCNRALRSVGVLTRTFKTQRRQTALQSHSIGLCYILQNLT